jgi:hypothetical protein
VVPPLFDVLLEELLDPPVAPPLLDVLLEELLDPPVVPALLDVLLEELLDPPVVPPPLPVELLPAGVQAAARKPASKASRRTCVLVWQEVFI